MLERFYQQLSSIFPRTLVHRIERLMLQGGFEELQPRLFMGFALFFSFIVLAVQFNSLKLPALILGSVPFCLAGSAGLLLATGKPLGATVIIGVLVVLAAVVNAGVLLFTYARVLQDGEGLTVRDAILKSAQLRLRPIVMVTSAILIGLVPLALALEAGGDMLQPMAIAAIGGLLMENFVSLYLMPVLYLMANRDRAALPATKE